jgi:hypothetical protein
MAKTSAHQIIPAELTVPGLLLLIVSALVEAEFNAAKGTAVLIMAD